MQMAQHKHTTMHAYYMNIRVYVEQETRKKPKEEAENQIQVGKQRNKQLEISEARRWTQQREEQQQY